MLEHLSAAAVPSLGTAGDRAPNAHISPLVNAGMTVPRCAVVAAGNAPGNASADDDGRSNAPRRINLALAFAALPTGEGVADLYGARETASQASETAISERVSGVRGFPPEAAAGRVSTIGRQYFPPPLNSDRRGSDGDGGASRHERRRERFTLRRAGRRIYETDAASDLRGTMGRLPRWARCGWTAAGGSVEVHASTDATTHQRRAWWGGVVTCGSVWACAVCSAKILAKRTEETLRVDEWARAQGGRAYLVTFTVRHDKRDELAPLLRGLSRAWQAMQSGEPWRRFRERCEVLGYVRRLEMTRGSRAGWHPHLHVIVWSKRDIASELPWLNGRWSAMVARRMDEHVASAAERCTPLDVERRAEGVRRRRRRCSKLEVKGASSSVRATAGGTCAKAGPGWSRRATSSSACELLARVVRRHRPSHGQGVQIEPLRTDQGVKYALKAVLEVTSSDTKAETRGAAWTMAKLLRRACDLEPYGGERHSPRARVAWLEYVRATRGRRLLGWSTGLRKAAGLEPDTPDKALADELAVESSLVARFDAGAWVRLRRYPRAVCGVLEAVEARRWGDVVAAGGVLEAKGP